MVKGDKTQKGCSPGAEHHAECPDQVQSPGSLGRPGNLPHLKPCQSPLVENAEQNEPMVWIWYKAASDWEIAREDHYWWFRVPDQASIVDVHAHTRFILF